MKNIIFAFILCLLIQGCASTLSMFKIDPQTLSGQEAISQEGIKAVISRKNARVTIRPSADTYSSEDRLTIVVSVYGAEEPFNFSTRNIQAFVDGKPHRVFTYDELVADIKEQERTLIAKAEDQKSSQYMEGLGAQATIQADAKIFSIQKKTISVGNSASLRIFPLSAQLLTMSGYRLWA